MPMDTHYDSTDRTPSDYFLFALAFLGFMIGVGGVVVASAPAAFTGFILMLLSILSYALRPSRAE
jgi:hypothetical protein